MSLRPIKGRVALSILGVYTHKKGEAPPPPSLFKSDIAEVHVKCETKAVGHRNTGGSSLGVGIVALRMEVTPSPPPPPTPSRNMYSSPL